MTEPNITIAPLPEGAWEAVVNHPDHYLCLNRSTGLRVALWVRRRIAPAKSNRLNCTSYGLKHIMAREIAAEEGTDEGDWYITNGQMKGIMLGLGFEPTHMNEVNWGFKARWKRGEEPK